jgi:hypothetical protein
MKMKQKQKMKPIKINNIMSNLEDYFLQNTCDLVTAISEEKYELATKIRDDMDQKIFKIYDLLLNNDLTKADPELLYDLLVFKKNEYIKEWEEILQIPLERRLDL